MPPKKSPPPPTYSAFTRRYPKLSEAWDNIRAEEKRGPLDLKTTRLIKLAVAIGAFREGAVHSAVRKAITAGCSRAEIEHVIALSAATLGMPSTVAVDSWVQELLDR